VARQHGARHLNVGNKIKLKSNLCVTILVLKLHFKTEIQVSLELWK
jgi:hypothetical protein